MRPIDLQSHFGKLRVEIYLLHPPDEPVEEFIEVLPGKILQRSKQVLIREALPVLPELLVKQEEKVIKRFAA